MFELSGESWQHRKQRRQAVIALAKRSLQYEAYVVNRHLRGHVPKTPDAMDKAMSERQWGSEHGQWRSALPNLSSSVENTQSKQVANLEPAQNTQNKQDASLV